MDEYKLYTIDEVARILQETKPTLRFWEQNFPSIAPVRDSNGKRRYRDSDISELSKIKKLLKINGYTIQGAKDFLKSPENICILRVVDDLKALKRLILGSDSY